MGKTVTELAPAKINLYLHITGKRHDGYHELDSLVVFTQLGDKIDVEESNTIVLSTCGDFSNALPSNSKNIAFKAAKRLQYLTGTKTGAKITLNKKLPVASGIGGGSSDAAAVIRSLIKFWSVSITKAELNKLTFSLGADVPVCFNKHSTYMGNIGQTLSPSPVMPSFWLVLVNPGVEVQTTNVFELHSQTLPPIPRFLEPPENIKSLAFLLSKRRNDLEIYAKRLVPEISEVLDSLIKIPNVLLARMSGSGATCFGLFENLLSADLAVNILTKNHPTWWIKKTQLIP